MTPHHRFRNVTGCSWPRRGAVREIRDASGLADPDFPANARSVITELMARQRLAVAGLAPGYFALVMASGIISIGLELQGFEVLSMILLLVCATAFVVLLSLTAWRFVSFRSAFRGDFMDPRRAFGFFTFVAGTNVLGVRLGMEGWYWATALLLTLSGLAWLVFGYVIPWTAVLGREERPVVITANGTWFIWVVASQSVAIAAATLEPVIDNGRRELALLAVTSWSVGGLLVRCGRRAGHLAPDALRIRAGGSHSALLGLHGRTGDHGAGRR